MRKTNIIFLFIVFFTSAALAADSAPAKKKKLTLQDLLKSSSGSTRRSATVAGVRGLDETGSDIDTKARNYVAIERLEKVVISEAELKTFMDSGKLK